MNCSNQKKRILLVDLGACMGGVEVHLEALADILHGNAEVFAICALKELATRLEKHGVHVHTVPLFSRTRILRFVSALFLLSFVVVSRRIDIVQVNGFLEAILLIPARLLMCETVYTRHGPFELELYKWHQEPAKFFPRAVARVCAHFASRVVCVSETVGSLVAPLLPRGRVTVVPNWVTQRPYPADIPTGNLNRIKVLYVGRLEAYKGLHLLIDAMRHSGASLVVLGEGKYRPELEQLADGLDITFAGFQTDTTRYYESADIFVMPSMGPEGLPMVTLEAMSHGLACLFSDLPVHREITENGRAAMLFRTGDVEDLRTKLAVLVESAAKRMQYAHAARQIAQSKYHPAAAKRAYLRVFAVQE
jgi:glycosyltransferase involved in cell wall biosynthesis